MLLPCCEKWMNSQSQFLPFLTKLASQKFVTEFHVVFFTMRSVRKGLNCATLASKDVRTEEVLLYCQKLNLL